MLDENLDEYQIALGLPGGSSERLIKLKLAQVEVESKHRIEDETLRQLDEKLKVETEKLISLKEKVDQVTREKTSLWSAVLNRDRQTEYYKSKIDEIDLNRLDILEDDLKVAQKRIIEKRDKLKRLNQSLEEFGHLEPTNKALEAKIKELKESRLSLEMTFVEE